MTSRSTVLGILAVLVACSCSNRLQSYFPVTSSSVWKYTVQGEFDTFPDTVKTVGRVPVGQVEGFELVGGMGVSRLAWQGDTLLASELAGQRFHPPIPLLAPTALDWTGTWESGGKAKPANAKFSWKPTETTVSGRKTKALESVLKFVANGRTTVLTTWFVEGIGIYRQEQRTDDRRDRRLDYLSGP